ncbi:MAG: flagella basal body P-ring formation protein FlgA [Bdellovibrionota bacterium]
MIDIPVPVYIEYKNLSPVVTQAEHQKDLIASVLKKVEGQAKFILEYSGEKEQISSTNNLFWEAKCIVCFNIPDDSFSVVLSSVKKTAKNNGEIALLTFDTFDSPGRISSWKIEMTEVKPIVVRSGKDVKINFNSTSGIAIQGVGKSLKNASRGETIRVQVSNWFQKINSPNSTEIIEAKVIAPNEVEYVTK